MKTPLEVLSAIEIPIPCSAPWSAMTGDDRARHCGLCDRIVHDLSRMSAADAARLLEAGNWDTCIRYSRNADGTVRTADNRISRSGRSARLFAALAASWLGLLSAAGCDSQGKPCLPKNAVDKQPSAPEAGCEGS